MTIDALPTPIDEQLNRCGCRPGDGGGLTARPDQPSAMSPSGGQHLTEPDLDAIAWRFFASEFAGLSYAGWPVERRVDAYLTRHGMRRLVNDGDAYDAVLKHVLTNVGPALRSGVLANTTSLTARRHSAQDGSGPRMDAESGLATIYVHTSGAGDRPHARRRSGRP
jgi:hypothetical protein